MVYPLPFPLLGTDHQALVAVASFSPAALPPCPYVPQRKASMPFVLGMSLLMHGVLPGLAGFYFEPELSADCCHGSIGAMQCMHQRGPPFQQQSCLLLGTPPQERQCRSRGRPCPYLSSLLSWFWTSMCEVDLHGNTCGWMWEL